MSAERTTRDGERVFITGSEVFPLGIPLKIKITPVDLVGGYRSPAVGRLVTYGGAGVTFVEYEETSDFSADDENVKEDGVGFVLMGEDRVEKRSLKLGLFTKDGQVEVLEGLKPGEKIVTRGASILTEDSRVAPTPAEETP